MPGLRVELSGEPFQRDRRGEVGVHGKGQFLGGFEGLLGFLWFLAVIENIGLGDQPRKILWKIDGGGDGLGEVAKEKPTLCDECFVEVFGFAEAFGCFWSFFENAFEELKFFDGGFGRACLGFFFGGLL